MQNLRRKAIDCYICHAPSSFVNHDGYTTDESMLMSMPTITTDLKNHLQVIWVWADLPQHLNEKSRWCCYFVKSSKQASTQLTCTRTANELKDHGQSIPRFVIRRYLEKSIQKKLFCHLQWLQIKTIFQEKTIINSISENLLSRFIYGRDVIGANW